MLREYIISEAMHALGIPTTRSLAVVATGQSVIREEELPGAILTRVAASHLRFGTFQYAAARDAIDDLRALADYTWDRHFKDSDAGENRYLSLLRNVIQRQASLIAKWQQAGFIHGVMNTDNMTLSGETIDYGPCAFMDAYDPETVFSSIDSQGRYAYGNQPRIAMWNLARLAEALLPLLHDDEEQAVRLAEEAISQFSELYSSNWLAGMRAKLGVFNEEPEDEALIDELLKMMQKHGADYTNTFRALTWDRTKETVLHGTAEFVQWHGRWQARRSRQEQAKPAS
ncbi:protein adenylyltransferase SelO family protein, partial [Paenibacillus sepulcri]|nr:protein adenylyltransferase SelO family protein [Paenibacillus sepulcri]